MTKLLYTFFGAYYIVTVKILNTFRSFLLILNYTYTHIFHFFLLGRYTLIIILAIGYWMKMMIMEIYQLIYSYHMIQCIVIFDDKSNEIINI